MAVDKLVDSTQLNTDLTAVANAIRAKGGTSASLSFPTGFIDAIDAIQTGGGGGIDVNDLVMGTAPSGKVVLDTATQIPTYSLYAKTAITSIFASSVTCVGAYAIQSCAALETFVSTKLNAGIGNYGISKCTALDAIDLAGRTNSLTTYANNAFNGDTHLTKLIIRGSAVPTLGGTAAFTNTPFASGGSGGTLYVPSALISDYQAASNWSTILGYATNSIVAIEGSIYETQYADGTPIT
jgi:hypothetical protein